MELKLTIKGNADALVNYLKAVENATQSILLEFDVKEKRILTKVVTERFCALRYSVLSFDDANIVVPEGQTIQEGRIMFGMMNSLSKFIKILSSINESTKAQNDENASFNIRLEYGTRFTKNKASVLAVTGTVFESKVITIKFPGFDVKEFYSISDAACEKALSTEGGYACDLSESLLTEILSYTAIFKSKTYVFDVTETGISISDGKLDERDTKGDIVRKFTRKIHTFETPIDTNFNLVIGTDFVIKLLGKSKENYTLYVLPQKICLTSKDSPVRYGFSAIVEKPTAE